MVSNRVSLDSVCTSMVSPDLMLRRWLSWTLRLSQTLRRLHGFLLRAADAELGLADEVVVAELAPALLGPRIGRGVLVGSSIQSRFLAGCSHLFGVHGPCGTHSIWCHPFSRGLTSSGIATSGTVHVVLRVGPATLRPSEGCIDEVNTAAAAQAEVVPCDP